MTTTMFSNTVSQNKLESSQAYEVIENELLKSCDLKDLTISGSLFSLTTFINVTFRSCVFFGSRFENCKFVNCRFEDCSFQFSTLTHSQFSATEFVGTHWESPSIRKCSFDYSSLDMKTEYFIAKNSNYLESCYLESDSLKQFEDATATITTLPPLPPEAHQNNGDEASSVDELWDALFNRQIA